VDQNYKLLPFLSVQCDNENITDRHAFVWGSLAA